MENIQNHYDSRIWLEFTKEHNFEEIIEDKRIRLNFVHTGQLQTVYWWKYSSVSKQTLQALSYRQLDQYIDVTRQESTPIGCQTPACQPSILHSEQVRTWLGSLYSEVQVEQV